MADIDLLNKLSSMNVSKESKEKEDTDKSKTDSLKFKQELDKTKLTIFRPIADCGYYGWHPMNEAFLPLSELLSRSQRME